MRRISRQRENETSQRTMPIESGHRFLLPFYADLNTFKTITIPEIQ